jgi:hypothetical protein
MKLYFTFQYALSDIIVNIKNYIFSILLDVKSLKGTYYN